MRAGKYVVVLATVLATFANSAVHAAAPAGGADFDRALALHAREPGRKAAKAALPLYKKACVAGFGRACTEWGHLRYFADGVPMDLPDAASAYEKGCDVGEYRSCIMLARMKQLGFGFEVDLEAAATLIDRAVEVGGNEGALRVSELLQGGGWLREDEARAQKIRAAVCKDGSCGRRNRDQETAQAEADSLKVACGGGDNKACLRGALLLQEYGRGDVDPQVAQMLELACAADQGQACSVRAELGKKSRSASLDVERRVALWAKACSLQDALGCTALGFEYANRGATKENMSRAFDYLRRGCALGSANACTRLADQLGRDGPRDVARGPIYERACESRMWDGGCNVARMSEGFQDGHRYLWTCKKVSRNACVKAGMLFVSGPRVRQIVTYFDLVTDGVPENPKLAAEAFKLGCDQGEPRSCGQLALLHHQGKSLKKDEPLALELWTKSCDDGDGMSCSVLGLLTARGASGLTQDRARGIALYEKGCEHGWGNGCLESGWAYLNADAVAQDVDKARILFERGCEVGDDTCCHRARTLKEKQEELRKNEANCEKDASYCVYAADKYAEGLGVGRDVEKAAALYETACKSSNWEYFEADAMADACFAAAIYVRGADADRERFLQRACDQDSARSSGGGQQARGIRCAALVCAQGDGNMCLQVGRALWSDRQGVHRHVSFDWIERGCGLGASDCAAALTMMRKAALEIPEDNGWAPVARRVLPKIRKAFQARCEAADARACLVLASMVKSGEGGAPDAQAATAYVKKACDLGDADACIAARAAP